jgi:hypothetical protein
MNLLQQGTQFTDFKTGKIQVEYGVDGVKKKTLV